MYVTPLVTMPQPSITYHTFSTRGEKLGPRNMDLEEFNARKTLLLSHDSGGHQAGGMRCKDAGSRGKQPGGNKCNVTEARGMDAPVPAQGAKHALKALPPRDGEGRDRRLGLRAVRTRIRATMCCLP